MEDNELRVASNISKSLSTQCGIGNNGDKEEKEVQMALVQSCLHDIEHRVTRHLSNGVFVDSRDDIGRTGLMHAAASGHENIVTKLIQRGADVDAIDKTGTTALMISSANGHFGTVAIILEYTGNVDTRDETGCTALMRACENGQGIVVELLVKHGADVHAITYGEDYKTVLWFAVSRKQAKVVDLLLDHGAVVNKAFGKLRTTALLVAIKGGYEDIIQILFLKGASVYTQKSSELDENILLESFHSAESNIQILDLLIKHGADINNSKIKRSTPFLYACKHGLKNVVKYLLENGVNLNRGFDESEIILGSILRGKCWDENVMRLLVDRGLDIHYKTDKGETALMVAVMHGQVSLVKILIEMGIDIDARCDEGESAVMRAVDYGEIACLKTLISAGATLDFTAKEGHTMLAHAMSIGCPLGCLSILLTEGVLVERGQLKQPHKNSQFTFNNSLDALLMTMERGVFEWKMCSHGYFKEVYFRAMDLAICPGQFDYEYNDDYTKTISMSPLIMGMLNNDAGVVVNIVNRLYFYREDYRRLVSDKELRARISNSDSLLLDKLTLQPMSLFAWSFITVSRAISMTGPHTQRRQRVETLPIPVSLKKRLTFQLA